MNMNLFKAWLIFTAKVAEFCAENAKYLFCPLRTLRPRLIAVGYER